MNLEFFTLLIAWIIIVGFIWWLEIVNRKQKNLNEIHKERNKVIKHKRN